MNIEVLEILQCSASLYKKTLGPFLLEIGLKEEDQFIAFNIVIDPRSNTLRVQWTIESNDLSQLASEIKKMINDLDTEKFLRFVVNTNFKAIELWS